MRKRKRLPSSAALERELVRALEERTAEPSRIEELSKQWFAACMRERRAKGQPTLPDPVAEEDREEARLLRGPRPTPAQILEALRASRNAP